MESGGGDAPVNQVPTPVSIVTPPPRLSSIPNVVFLEPGELWRKGATSSLLAMICPPKAFEECTPLTDEDHATLRHVRENSLKMASLVESYEGLHVKCVKAATLNVALTQKLSQTGKEKGSLEKKVKELEEKVTRLESSLSTSEATVKMALKTQAAKEAELKLKDEAISKLKGKVVELLAEMSKTVADAFNNVVNQARVLYPNLVNEGMGFINMVKDGKIVSY